MVVGVVEVVVSDELREEVAEDDDGERSVGLGPAPRPRPRFDISKIEVKLRWVASDEKSQGKEERNTKRFDYYYYKFLSLSTLILATDELTIDESIRFSKIYNYFNQN